MQPIAITAQVPTRHSLPNISAKLKCRTDRQANCIATVAEDVTKQVIVDEIHIQANRKVFRYVDVRAASESVEGRPISFLARRRQLRGKGGGDRVLRMQRSRLVDRSERRPNVKRYERPAVKAKLRTGRIRFSSRVNGQREHVSGWKTPCGSQLGELCSKLLLQGRREQIRRQGCVAAVDAVVQPERHPGSYPDAPLRMESSFSQIDVRTIKVHKTCVGVKTTDVALLGKSAGAQQEKTNAQNGSQLVE